MQTHVHLRTVCTRNPEGESLVTITPGSAQDEPTQAGLLVATALALNGCGGSSDSNPAPAPVPTPTPVPPADTIGSADAARFVLQASLSVSEADIARVKALGYSAWLDEQIALPRTTSHWDWMISKGYQSDVNNINSFRGADNTIWRKLLSSPDGVRQRMVMALGEIFVVSMAGLPVPWRSFCVAAYVDILEANAFGTYRNLIEAVTLSTAMGNYLNMRGNRLEDPATGRVPDENYAREILQLFSIGLTELNADGTAKLGANGKPLESYTQETVTGLAKVFTGWDYTQFNRDTPNFQQLPMSLIASRHSTQEANFLGTTVAAGTAGGPALKIALDTISAHPNVGPFLCRQLIQRLVTSNPSNAYVGRVTAVFADNGNGMRGDLKAVFKAILLDAEARLRPGQQGTSWGRLREPMLRLVQWGRTFGVTSPTDAWNIGDTSDPSQRLGQSPFRSPSVFNFFRPGYVPPNTALGSQSLVAPELQITNESTVVAYANFMQTAIQNGVGEVKTSYTPWLATAGDASTLIDNLSLLLSGGQFSSATRATITSAVASIDAASDAGKLNRVQAAILLIMTAPEYLVQK
jgi:uncharacterized protein (DUF1800 family)